MNPEEIWKKPLRVLIIGPDGPCGKTHLQYRLKEFLEENGAEVIDVSECRPLHREKITEVRRRLKASKDHNQHYKLDFRGQKISIDVIGV